MIHNSNLISTDRNNRIIRSAARVGRRIEEAMVDTQFLATSGQPDQSLGFIMRRNAALERKATYPACSSGAGINYNCLICTVVTVRQHGQVVVTIARGHNPTATENGIGWRVP